MAERRRTVPMGGPLRGAGFVLALGFAILGVAAAIAAVLVWVMT